MGYAIIAYARTWKPLQSTTACPKIPKQPIFEKIRENHNYFLFLPYIQWDEKITTLPGLYFVTIGILNPLSKWSNQWLCTTSNLRLINLGFLILTFIVLSRLMQQIHGGKHVSSTDHVMIHAEGKNPRFIQ